MISYGTTRSKFSTYRNEIKKENQKEREMIICFFGKELLLLLLLLLSEEMKLWMIFGLALTPSCGE